MRKLLITLLAAGHCVVLWSAASMPEARKRNPNKASLRPNVPRTWDDPAIAKVEVPLANPAGSPKHVSADYYYKIPVRPIYKQYPVYAPGREPQGYMDWLGKQKPEIVWGVDPVTGVEHAPSLKTKADWIKAGEIVFDSPIVFAAPPPPPVVRQLYQSAGRPVTSDGIDPFVVFVMRQKGKVEAAFAACADCHTRVMPDGTLIKGAQGNNPIDRGTAIVLRALAGASPDKAAVETDRRLALRAQFEVPWLKDSERPDYGRMSLEEMAAVLATIPPGVFARQGTSPFSPPHIPDLIGIKDRKYLDATGLEQHRGIVDLMRYAALNQGADSLASYNGFVPADAPSFKTLPDPGKINPFTGSVRPERYSDEQLYALALYLYSLEPPSNPNRFDAIAARGQKVFKDERCGRCHTPPLYTNNKLTPAEGFVPPAGAERTYDIRPRSVGTDPGLALNTRRGTGYYKVPSLKGVWYRGMFGHSGWCATLEDWFDPRRTRDDYVPTGFKPYGSTTYAVEGHPFGLDLPDEDRKALIAFLRTL